MLMLLDVHAVLDHLYLDGTRPQITDPAEAWLRESGSPYTLPGLIDALDEVINLLTRAEREAFRCIPPGITAHNPADHGNCPVSIDPAQMSGDI